MIPKEEQSNYSFFASLFVFCTCRYLKTGLYVLQTCRKYDQASTWTVENQWLTGKGGMDTTYSLGDLNLYVMNPDEDSVKQISKRIQEVVGACHVCIVDMEKRHQYNDRTGQNTGTAG